MLNAVTSRVDILSVDLTSEIIIGGEILFLGEIVHNCRKKNVCSKRWKLGIDCFLMKFKVSDQSIGYHM